MELKQYTALLWRWKWLILLGTLLAGISAFVASRLQTPVYQATTTLLINQAPSTNVNDYTSILTSERLAQTYVQMLTDRPVLDEVIKRLSLTTTTERLGATISVQMVTNTQLITVKVEDTNSALTAAVANTLAEVFAEQNTARQVSRYAASKDSLQKELDRLQAEIHGAEQAVAKLGTPSTDKGLSDLARLQTELAQDRQSYTNLLQSYEALRVAEAQSVSNVIPVEPATPPRLPIRPRTLLNTLLAAIVGAMLAVGVVFLMEYLDDSVRTPEEVERTLGLPLIGAIAAMPDSPPGKPYVADQPRSPVAEAFRSLRTNIQFAGVDRPIHTLLITSPGPEDGKSTVAANLAVIMAQGGKRVLLLDADLRRPRLHKFAGLPNDIGLTDLFIRTPLSLDGAVQSTLVEGLRAVTSGSLPPNPAELLGSERMQQILALLKQNADVVVVDSPPAAAVTDPTVLAAHCDGVLLVLEPGKSPRGAASLAVENLRRAGARLIGVVFNNVPLKRAGYYGAYSYQYSYSHDGPGAKTGGSRSRRRERA